jgi:hypothetical protein
MGDRGGEGGRVRVVNEESFARCRSTALHSRNQSTQMDRERSGMQIASPQ